MHLAAVPLAAALLLAGPSRARATQAEEGDPAEPRGEVVVLIHGLGLAPVFLRVVKLHLEGEGFRVLDWPYPSLREPIEDLAGRLDRDLRQWDQDVTVTRIHIVAHSLGGVVARAALCRAVPSKMGRVVMLAPPNHGSRWARWLTPLLSRWMVPLPELSDDPRSFVNRLGVPEGVSIGVIAARRDGKVRVEDTHLRGEADHLVVEGWHTFFMNRPSTLRQISTFLREGRFRREAHPGEDAAPPAGDATPGEDPGGALEGAEKHDPDGGSSSSREAPPR